MVEGSTTSQAGAVRWQLLLVVLGALSVAPPYIGPELGLELDVSSSVEFVDHVLPGIAVIAFGAVAVLLERAGGGGSARWLAAMGACFLAALWNATSHVPLWLDAGEPGAGWGAVVLHGSLGFPMAALAFWLLVRHREPA